MKVGTFQFAASDNIEENKRAIIRGIELAAKENVRFLITQECGLCGYPPIETESVDKINFTAIEKALIEIKQLATKNNLYIGVGAIIKSGSNKYYNSIELITPNELTLPPYYKRALWGWDRESY
jgi:omega-amidase